MVKSNKASNTMTGSIGSALADWDVYKHKYLPNLWTDIRELVCLITAIISYHLVTFMAIFDYRQSIPILVFIYICDLLYLFNLFVPIFKKCKIGSRFVRITRRRRATAAAGAAAGENTTSALNNHPTPAANPGNTGAKHCCTGLWNLLVNIFSCRKWKRRICHFFSKHYWKKNFWWMLDILSVLPLECFVLLIVGSYQGHEKEFLMWISCLRLNRLLRMYRVMNFYRKKMRQLSVNLTRREVVALSVCFITFLVILFHGITCLWYRMNCDGVYNATIPVQCYTFNENGYSDTSLSLSIPRTTKQVAEGSDRYWPAVQMRGAGDTQDPPLGAPQLVLPMSVRAFGFLMCTAVILGSVYIASQIDLKLLPLVLFHIYIIGCIASVLACPPTGNKFDMGKNTNSTTNNTTNTTVCTRHPTPTNVNKTKPAIATSDQLYIYSFYYVGTTSVGLGFGDFKPTNHEERVFSMFLFFCYIFVVMFILATFAGSRSHSDYKLLRFQQQMKYLIGFISSEQLDTKLARRITRHYNYQWARNHGVEPERLFASLFPALCKEVAVDVLEDVFGNVAELKGVPENFLRTICVYMIPIYFLRRDIIVRRHDICDTIYFVYRGKVAVCTLESEDEMIIEQGGIIGILDPRLKTPLYDRTIVSVTNVDLFAIPRTDFIRALELYPEVNERFVARNEAQAKELEELTQKLEELRVIAHSRARLRRNKGGRTRPRAASIHVWRNKRGRRRARSFANQRSRSLPGIGMQSRTAAGFLSSAAPSTTTGTIQSRRAALPSKKSRSRASRFSTSASVALRDDHGEHHEQQLKSEQEKLESGARSPSCCAKFFTFLVLQSAALSASLAFYQFTFQNYQIGYFAVGYVFDAIFVIKMSMGFRVTYPNSRSDMTFDSSDSPNKYVSDMTAFPLDFFSTIPIDLFSGVYAAAVAASNKYSTKPALFWWAALRLNRVIRLSHILIYYKRSTKGLFTYIMALKIERIIVSTLIYVHFMACILESLSNYVELQLPCICDGGGKGMCRTRLTDLEDWFHKQSSIYKGDDPTLGDHKYPLTLYLIVTTFTSTLYADGFPGSVFQILFITFIAYAAKIWLCLVLSDIMSGLQNNMDLSYHLAADGVMKLYKEYGVSRNILDKTAEYFAYTGTQHRVTLFPDFLANAPACMKMDICTAIYGIHFKKNYLFRGLADSFIRQACIRLKQEWILAGDFVIHAGEIDDRLYFIHHGIIAHIKQVVPVTFATDVQAGSSPEPIAGPSNATDTQIIRKRRKPRSTFTKEERIRMRRAGASHVFMSKSKFFGDVQALLGPHPHNGSYRAETIVGVVSLSHADMQALFKQFPEYRGTIMRRFNGRRRHKEVRAAKAERNNRRGGGRGGPVSGRRSAGATTAVEPNEPNPPKPVDVFVSAPIFQEEHNQERRTSGGSNSLLEETFHY